MLKRVASYCGKRICWFDLILGFFVGSDFSDRSIISLLEYVSCGGKMNAIDQWFNVQRVFSSYKNIALSSSYIHAVVYGWWQRQKYVMTLKFKKNFIYFRYDVKPKPRICSDFNFDSVRSWIWNRARKLGSNKNYVLFSIWSQLQLNMV